MISAGRLTERVEREIARVAMLLTNAIEPPSEHSVRLTMKHGG